MSGMKITKKIEIELLNLKFITENLDLVEMQLNEGAKDLHFRLSHFRKQVSESDKAKYDKQFFGEKPENENDNQGTDIALHSEKKHLPTLHKKKEQWLKKIYRKIVTSTHPDKFENFPVKILKEKYLNVYRKAVFSWEKEEYDQILLCAYETDIVIEDPKALPILTKGTTQKSNRINEVKKLTAHQWYHVPEQDRPQVLENYLKNLGYEFSKSDIKKVVNLARKRKVGTRPEKLKRN
jgi:hypothetical protein